MGRFHKELQKACSPVSPKIAEFAWPSFTVPKGLTEVIEDEAIEGDCQSNALSDAWSQVASIVWNQ